MLIRKLSEANLDESLIYKQDIHIQRLTNFREKT